MAEKTEDTVYSTKTLSKYFALASIALLIVVIWAVIEDYDREWKSYMRQAHSITATVADLRLAKVQQDTDKEALAKVEQDLVKIKAERENVVKEIDARLSDLNDDYYRKNQVFQSRQGQLDAMLYQVDHAIGDQKPYAARMKAEYQELVAETAKLKRAADDAEREINIAREKRASILEDQKKLEDEHFRLTNDAERLRKTRRSDRIAGLFRLSAHRCSLFC
jgi:chromosome segregation ATPase